MFVVYRGPSDAVEVPALNVVARRGEPMEVPDEVATELLRQDCWQPDKPTTAVRDDRKGK